MSYDYFEERVSTIAANAGVSAKIHRKANGYYYAYCSSGETITSSPSSPRVCVLWGNGHAAYATI